MTARTPLQQRHPIQPLELDMRGVLRFKRNSIVDHCVKAVGLKELRRMDFSAEDWNQVAQLIGYSHSGAPSYLNEETWQTAHQMHTAGLTEAEARIVALSELLELANDKLRRAANVLIGYCDE